MRTGGRRGDDSLRKGEGLCGIAVAARPEGWGRYSLHIQAICRTGECAAPEADGASARETVFASLCRGGGSGDSLAQGDGTHIGFQRRSKRRRGCDGIFAGSAMEREQSYGGSAQRAHYGVQGALKRS